MTAALLSDTALLDAVRELAFRSAALEAELIEHLAELDLRELFLHQGFTSLFAYCIEELHFSESVAYQRIAVARAARTFPRVLDALRAGQVHLSGLRLLAPHLTATDERELIDAARHKSKRAIEQLIANLAPKPATRSLVRRVPVRAPTGPGASSPAIPPAALPRAPLPMPLGGERYAVSFIASAETRAKLDEARALLRHRIPDGDIGRILDRALDALLREVRKARFAEIVGRDTETTAGSPEPATRHIPAAIRRAVVRRDGLRCTFVAGNGHRCDTRDALEFHHLVPFGRVRRHRVDEITLRCRAHNRLAAIQEYGSAQMDAFRRRSS